MVGGSDGFCDGNVEGGSVKVREEGFEEGLPSLAVVWCKPLAVAFGATVSQRIGDRGTGE